MMNKSILFSCILLLMIFFPVTSCKTTPPANPPAKVETDPDKMPPERDLLNDLDAAIARAAKAKESATYLRGHIYFPDEYQKAEADNENGRKTGRSTVEDTKQAIASFSAAAEAFEEIAENSRPLYEKDLADARIELEKISIRADKSRKNAIDYQGYLYFHEEWKAAETIFQECFETAPEEKIAEPAEDKAVPISSPQPKPEAVTGDPIVIEKPNRDIEEGLVIRGSSANATYDEIKAISAEFFTAADMFDDIAANSAALYAEEKESARKNLQQAAARAEQSRKEAQNNQANVYFANEWREAERILQSGKNIKPNTVNEINAAKELFVSAADKYDDLAVKSRPLAAKANSEKALNTAIARTEKSRQGAMAVDGQTYFPNDWKNAETRNTCAKSAKKTTAEEINAAVALFNQAADAYDDITKKSGPMFTKEKNDSSKELQTAIARMDKSRKQASDAGGQDYFPAEWKNAETKNQDAKNAKRATPAEMRAAADLYTSAADAYDDIAKKSGPIAKEKNDSSKALQTAIARMDKSRKQASDAGGQVNFPAEWKNAETKNQNAKNAKKTTPAEMKAAADLYTIAADSYDDIAGKSIEKTAQTAKSRAEKERQTAVELKANIAARDDFNKADALFTQAQSDYTAKSFPPAAQKYTQAADQFAAASKSIEKKRTLAEEAINKAKELSANTKKQAMDAGLNEEDIETSQYFTESTNLIAQADKNMSESQFDDALKNAEEAVKNLNLFDSYIAQMALDKMTDNKMPDEVIDEGDFLAEIPPESVVEPVVEETPAESAIAEIPIGPVLAAQYRVQTWVSARDCFWNISAKPQVYNDPWQWRILYNANRSKLRNQNNPDLLTPGMILDIPSIRGEVRSGMLNE